MCRVGNIVSVLFFPIILNFLWWRFEPLHSAPEIGKKLDKLTTFFSMQIFSHANSETG
jgi:hypothetical protein